jgi:hypothetical protein
MGAMPWGVILFFIFSGNHKLGLSGLDATDGVRTQIIGVHIHTVPFVDCSIVTVGYGTYYR